MSRVELGEKHTCDACSTRFYDLNRSPAVCFKCGAQQAPPKPRFYRPARVLASQAGFDLRLRYAAAQSEPEPSADLVQDEVEETEPVEEDDDGHEDSEEVEIDPEESKEHA